MTTHIYVNKLIQRLLTSHTWQSTWLYGHLYGWMSPDIHSRTTSKVAFHPCQVNVTFYDYQNLKYVAVNWSFYHLYRFCIFIISSSRNRILTKTDSYMRSSFRQGFNLCWSPLFFASWLTQAKARLPKSLNYNYHVKIGTTSVTNL